MEEEIKLSNNINNFTTNNNIQKTTSNNNSNDEKFLSSNNTNHSIKHNTLYSNNTNTNKVFSNNNMENTSNQYYSTTQKQIIPYSSNNYKDEQLTNKLKQYIGRIDYSVINKKSNDITSHSTCGILVSEHIALAAFDSILNNNDNSITCISFSLINNSPKHASKNKELHLPSFVSVVDFFLFSDMNNEINKINCWGLVLLDLPISSLLKEMFSTKESSNCLRISQKIGGSVNFNNNSNNSNENSNNDNFNYFYPIKSLNYSEIEKSEFDFVEIKQQTNKTNSSIYSKLVLNKYDISFNNGYLLLSNPSIRNTSTGIIIVTLNKKVYIVGITSKILLDFNNSNNNTKDQDQIKNEDNNENINNNNDMYYIAQTFNKDTILEINEKMTYWETLMENQMFSSSLFYYINSKVIIENDFFSLIKNNGKRLSTVINEYNEINNESLFIESYSVRISLLLIYNRLNSDSRFNSFSFNKLNLNTTGTEILSEILKYQTNVTSISLNNNNSYSLGLKALIKPSFLLNNLPQTFSLLSSIDLSNNKLSSKSGKYLRFIIRECSALEKLVLDNNFLNYLFLKYLLHAFKYKSQLKYFSINNNILGVKSGKYLKEILSGFPSLEVLLLENNSLEDGAVDMLVEGLLSDNDNTDNHSKNKDEFKDKENSKRFSYVKSINLSRNYLTSKVIRSVNSLINNSPDIQTINLANNCIFDEGVSSLFFNESDENNKDEDNSNNPNISLISLNLSNNQISDNGVINFLNKLSNEENIKISFLTLSRNFITDDSANSFIQFMKQKQSSLKSLKLSYCLISDITAQVLAESIMNNNTILEELMVNSNSINEQGCVLLLDAFNYSNNLIKLNIENNSFSFRENDINIERLTKRDGKVFY